LDIALSSHSGRRSITYELRIQIIPITITTTAIIRHVSTTTTATRGNISGIRPHQQSPPTREEQLLAMIATLQQQVNTMLLHQQESRVEVTKPQVFGGKIEEVSAFINAAHLYLRMKMTDKVATTQVAWVLSYVQGGIVEA